MSIEFQPCLVLLVLRLGVWEFCARGSNLDWVCLQVAGTSKSHGLKPDFPDNTIIIMVSNHYPLKGLPAAHTGPAYLRIPSLPICCSLSISHWCTKCLHNKCHLPTTCDQCKHITHALLALKTSSHLWDLWINPTNQWFRERSKSPEWVDYRGIWGMWHVCDV